MKELFVNIRGKLLDNKEKVAILICSLFIIIIIVFKVGSVISPNNLKGEMSQSAIDKGFKDENFYRCVIDNYNNDNETSLTISDDIPSNLNELKNLNCINKQIEDISGIENLTELSFANFHLNKLTEVNLNNNKNLHTVLLSNNNIKKIEYDQLENIRFYDTLYEDVTIVIEPYESFNITNNIKGVENIDIESNDKYTYEKGIFTNKDEIQMLVLSSDGKTVTASDFKFLSNRGYDIENYVIDGDDIKLFFYDDYYISDVLKDLRPMFDYKVNNNTLEIFNDDSLIKTYNIKGVKINNTKIIGDHIMVTLNYTGNIDDYIDYVSDDFIVKDYVVYNKNTGDREYYLVDFINIIINDYEIDDGIIYTGGEKFDTSKIKIYNNRYDDDDDEIRNKDLTEKADISVKNNVLNISVAPYNLFEMEFVEGKKKIAHNIKIDIVENGTANSNVQSALEGADINLTINPSDNYELDSVSILDKNNNDITGKVNYNNKTHSFVMPDYDIIINVKFKKIVTTVRSNSKAEEKTSNNKTTTTTKIKTTTESTTTGKITTTTKTIKNTTVASSKNNDVTIKKNSCSYYDIAIIMLIVVDIILVSIIIYKALKENNEDIR